MTAAGLAAANSTPATAAVTAVATPRTEPVNGPATASALQTAGLMAAGTAEPMATLTAAAAVSVVSALVAVLAAVVAVAVAVSVVVLLARTPLPGAATVPGGLPAAAPAGSGVWLSGALLAQGGGGNGISIGQFLTNLRNVLLGLLGSVTLCFFTIGAIRMIASGGEPGEVEQAKSALKSAAKGFVLTLLSPGLVALLQQMLGGGGGQ